jgi:hypothetical protein
LSRRIRLVQFKGVTRVGDSFPSPEKENKYSFQNVVFSTYLEFRMIDTVHKPSDSACYTTSLKPIRFNKFENSETYQLKDFFCLISIPTLLLLLSLTASRLSVRIPWIFLHFPSVLQWHWVLHRPLCANNLPASKLISSTQFAFSL